MINNFIQFILACDENYNIMFNQYGIQKISRWATSFQKYQLWFLFLLSVSDPVAHTENTRYTKLGFKWLAALKNDHG